MEPDSANRPSSGDAALLVTELRYTPAGRQNGARGLLGFVQCVVAGLLRVECALRRTRDGRLVLSFPIKHDAAGRQHSLVAPANAEARQAIESAVFEAVTMDLGAASKSPPAQGDSR